MLEANWTGHNILEVESLTKIVSGYCHDERFNQPNDICINKKGVVLASDADWMNKSGQLWKIGVDKKAVLLKNGMGTTNGICLSPDERKLYVNESTQLKVWEFNVDGRKVYKNSELTFLEDKELLTFDIYHLSGRFLTTNVSFNECIIF